MNQLGGPFVVIVLSVREGRGFTICEGDKAYLLEATLNSRKIESDPVPVCIGPIFTTELVWEIEKKEVRRLRSSHKPLRVECFCIDRDEMRQKIGFILLHLRSARPVTRSQLPAIDYKWNKLLGVHTDYKALHPELALTLTIRDKLQDMLIPQLDPLIDPQLIPLGTAEILEPLTQDISVIYQDEGYIQIGDKEFGKDNFDLSFLLETGFNFDLLVPNVNSLREPDEYFITLTFFNLPANSKKFSGLSEPILLNDKIVFKLRSSVDYIKQYIDELKTVQLKFCQSSDVLAMANVHINQLDLSKLKVNLHTKCEEDCILSLQNGSIPESLNGRKPFLSTQVALVRIAASDEFYTVQNSHINLSHRGFGDSKKNPKSYIQICEERKDSSTQTAVHVAKSTVTNLKDVSESNSLNKQNLIYGDEDYHLYSLTTNLLSVEWKIPPRDGFQFRFLHPKANTVLIVQCNSDQIDSNEVIILEDVKCNQFYISTSNYIATLMFTYPCKVIIYDSNNKNISEQFDLYTKLFLTQNSKLSEGAELCCCSYYAMICKANNEEDIICELQIQMILKDLGLRLECYEKTCFDLEPIILDERIAFKTLHEITTWKSEEQKKFTEKQLILENERLKLLNVDWESKKTDLEGKLRVGIEKCRVLSEELVKSSKELDDKRKIVEAQSKYSEDPEIIEMQVTEMLEQEMNQKISQMRKDNIQLLERVSQIAAEKEELRKYIAKKEQDFEEFKRSTLTEQQTSKLLQELRTIEEKYRQEQKRKEFFKEQWEKAVREVHMLKSADQKQIQMQIKKKKSELNQLSLEDFDKYSDTSETSGSLLSYPSDDVSEN